MVRLENMQSVANKELVEKLVKENISKEWLKDILQQKKFSLCHYTGELSLAEFFDNYIWDNLTEEQKEKVIQAINLLIEEDILIENQPDGNYCFDLLDLAVRLENKMPGKINSKPFLIWKEKDYFNLSKPIDHSHYVIKNLDEKIKRAFGK